MFKAIEANPVGSRALLELLCVPSSHVRHMVPGEADAVGQLLAPALPQHKSLASQVVAPPQQVFRLLRPPNKNTNMSSSDRFTLKPTRENKNMFKQIEDTHPFVKEILLLGDHLKPPSAMELVHQG